MEAEGAEAALSESPPPELFQVYLGETKFELTRTQIETDAPNYFTTVFLGDYTEATTKVVYTDRLAVNFPIVSSYLSDYDPIPLVKAALEEAPSKPDFLRTLKSDAEYFQLQGLLRALSHWIGIPQWQSEELGIAATRVIDVDKFLEEYPEGVLPWDALLVLRNFTMTYSVEYLYTSIENKWIRIRSPDGTYGSEKLSVNLLRSTALPLLQRSYNFLQPYLRLDCPSSAGEFDTFAATLKIDGVMHDMHKIHLLLEGPRLAILDDETTEVGHERTLELLVEKAFITPRKQEPHHSQFDFYKFRLEYAECRLAVSVREELFAHLSDLY